MDDFFILTEILMIEFFITDNHDSFQEFSKIHQKILIILIDFEKGDNRERIEFSSRIISLPHKYMHFEILSAKIGELGDNSDKKENPYLKTK